MSKRAIARSNSVSGLSAVSAGYAVTMSNPKAIIFYLALLPRVVILGQAAGAMTRRA